MAKVSVSVYEVLLAAAAVKRAAAIGEFITQHVYCYPGVTNEGGDFTTVRVACSCGDVGEFTLNTSVDVRVRRK